MDYDAVKSRIYLPWVRAEYSDSGQNLFGKTVKINTESVSLAPFRDTSQPKKNKRVNWSQPIGLRVALARMSSISEASPQYQRERAAPARHVLSINEDAQCQQRTSRNGNVPRWHCTSPPTPRTGPPIPHTPGRLYEFKTNGNRGSGGGGHFHILTYTGSAVFRVSFFSINS